MPLLGAASEETGALSSRRDRSMLRKSPSLVPFWFHDWAYPVLDLAYAMACLTHALPPIVPARRTPALSPPITMPTRTRIGGDCYLSATATHLTHTWRSMYPARRTTIPGLSATMRTRACMSGNCNLAATVTCPTPILCYPAERTAIFGCPATMGTRNAWHFTPPLILRAPNARHHPPASTPDFT